MTSHKSSVGLILFILLGMFSERSGYARQDIIPGSRYTSGRAAALGDAYLPLGDDAPSGLFYNPANLGRIRKTEIEPLNVSIYANTGYVGVVDSTHIDPFSLSAFAPVLAKKSGQMAGGGFSIVPSFAVPGFSLAVLMQSQLAAQMNSDGTITYKSLYQFIPTIGTGFRFFDGIFRVGYSAQWVNSAVGTPTVASSGSIGYDQGLTQGSALSNNIGVGVTIPMAFLPSFNFVARNLFGARYIPFSINPIVTSASVGVPATEPMTFDASFSISPRLGRGIYLNLILEDRDITNESGVAFIGHFAVGAEFSFADRFFLRGGWGSGYINGGIGIRKPGAEISISYYNEEIGSAYLQVADPRIMLQYQLRTF